MRSRAITRDHAREGNDERLTSASRLGEIFKARARARRCVPRSIAPRAPGRSHAKNAKWPSVITTRELYAAKSRTGKEPASERTLSVHQPRRVARIA